MSLSKEDKKQEEQFIERSCKIKVYYDLKKIAKANLKRMKTSGLKVNGLKVYKCQYCGGYHIGHRVKNPITKSQIRRFKTNKQEKERSKKS